MLLNQYTLVREGGRKENRFEYAVGIEGLPDRPVSPGIVGIGIVEEYASRVLGHPVEFFLIQGSRLFPAIRPLKQARLVLDLAVSEIDADVYLVSAELTDRRNVLVELCGRMTSAVHQGKQWKETKTPAAPAP